MTLKTALKYKVNFTNSFKKQYKKLKKQGKDLTKLFYVIEKLLNREELELKYRDHALVDNKYYKNYRECHIEPDWLLIYQYNDNELVLLLIETGSHSDLFK